MDVSDKLVLLPIDVSLSFFLRNYYELLSCSTLMKDYGSKLLFLQ